MIVPPASQDAVSMLDWLEASLFAQGVERISDSALADILAEADIDDPDDLLVALQQTLRTRARIIGKSYPFKRDGQGFSRKLEWQNVLPYSFMLFASLNQAYSELSFARGTAAKPAELFEELAAKAIQRYLDCTVIRIGAPRRSPVPASFPQALDYTVMGLGEAIGSRDLEQHTSGDDGVDLIAWRAFGDSRPSQAIMLAQCAIGTDWKDKRDGVNLEMWRRHIDWHSAPVKGFAVPFHHEPGNSWRETATRAGVIFDRLRIANLVKPDALATATRQGMTTWCQARLKKIKTLTIEPT